ncbi:hypothetical protein ACHHYP_20237 [Achlya hypogyna]|uniref:Uncharacterized protein n=1 Tax=Achlya hypogyna TaxID=1202772 RepID=A0A1V9YX39_ACHHY|nr:hypothetical protein ACHHYP_20237 [Achlya hypogyna]
MAGFAVAANAFQCDPSSAKQAPVNLPEGAPCGGWCGATGTCAQGLHCDEGLLPLAFMPLGLQLDSVCRNAAHDDALWKFVRLPPCASNWQLLSLTKATDLDKAATIASNAIMATRELQFDPCIRILSAQTCESNQYAILVQRIYEDAPKQYYLVEDHGDRPALPTATAIALDN